MLRTRSMAMLLLLLAAAPARAQTAARGAHSLNARMARFLEVLTSDERVEAGADALIPFFPRGGEWERVLTIHRGARGDSVASERFRTAEMHALTQPGGTLCASFDPGGGELSPAIGSLPFETWDHRGEWRAVRGTRFVAPGRGADSPVFVEWRRESGEWVVSAIGEERDEPQPDRRPSLPEITRDSARTELRLPLDAGARYAGERAWFTNRIPVELAGLRYLQYGLPRRLSPGEVVRFGTLDGVGVYVEPGAGRIPEAVYVAMSAEGDFQPYVVGPASWCNLPR